MELKGKKVAFLGDSITQGVGASSPDKNYVSQFATISGAEVFNFGVSATRIARRTIPHEAPSWNDCFLDRAERMTGDYDVIVVFGGTNDYGQQNPNPLGEKESIDEYTFYGALKALIEKLITSHPYATLVFATPLHREKEENQGLPGLKLKDYVDAIRQVTELYSVPVVDLWSNSGIQAKNHTAMQVFLLDGLHPNDAGHLRVAEKIYAFLKNL